MRYLLLLLSIFEILLITFAINYFGPYVSPIVFLIVSLLVAFIYLSYKNRRTVPEKPDNHTPVSTVIIAGSLFIIVTAGMFYKVHVINHQNSIAINDVSHSDIIPLIMNLVNRLVHGEYPYTPVPFSGYAIFPNYLPFTWMPYCFAEWLHVDYRWVPAIAFWLISLYQFIKTIRTRGNQDAFYKIIVSLWPLLLWHCMVAQEPTLIANTVEGLIASYYLLLAVSLLNRKIWLTGVALALCLFSRYGIVLWLPVLAAVLWLGGEQKKLFLSIAIVLAMGLIFYWIPFLQKDPSIFKKGFDYYTASTLGEWNNARNNNFWHMGNGLGFTRYPFALYPDKNPEALMNIYRKIHLAIVLFTITLLIVHYYRRRAQYAISTYLLFSLKLYLSVFYIFVQMPYKYLYLVPVAVTAILLLDTCRKNELPVIKQSL